MISKIIKTPASTLKIGDTILPPPREVSLWMNKALEERGLSKSALHLTIYEIDEASDKKGKWIVFRTMQSPEWYGENQKPYPFTFRVRPETKWKKVEA